MKLFKEIQRDALKLLVAAIPVAWDAWRVERESALVDGLITGEERKTIRKRVIAAALAEAKRQLEEG